MRRISDTLRGFTLIELVTAMVLTGILAAAAAGALLAVPFGFLTLNLVANQVATGLALTLLGLGLSGLIGERFVGQPGVRLQKLSIPGLSDIPFVGPILFGQDLLVYLSLALAVAVSLVIFKSRVGLILRAVGDNPHAVDTAGVSVAALRYRAVIVCGILCGFAGTYLAVAQSAGFVRDMTAGKGFIALAALVFAKWKPLNALFACLLFGMLDAVAIRLQGTPLPGLGTVPVQVFQALPYALTVVLLAGFIGRSIPPKASGIPYTKDR